MKPSDLLRRLPSRWPLRARGSAGAGPWDDLDPSEQAVADLLTRYAAGLSVGGPALSRTRSAVLTAAAEAAVKRSRAGTRRPAPSARPKLLSFAAVAAALAICMLGVTVSQLMPKGALGPGGSEAIGSRPSGSSAALAADLGEAEARLGDMDAAALRRDWLAVVDSADAYTAILMQMSVPDDAGGRALLEAKLGQQLTTLRALRADAPPAAQAAIDAAIARIEALLNDATQKDHPTPPSKSDRPDNSNKPVKSDKPTKPPKETKSPKVTKSPK
jgi:hypothetical protein